MSCLENHEKLEKQDHKGEGRKNHGKMTAVCQEELPSGKEELERLQSEDEMLEIMQME